YVPRGMDFRWRSVREYLDAFDAGGSAVNIVQLVGHGALRVAAMGFARRPPTAGELTAMQRALTDAVDAGAWGVSTGLIYAPGSYAATDEIVALARICARRRDTIYASHIRGEGATLLDAVAEAITVGREARVSVQVSHIKAAGRPNWGNVARALGLIDAAVAAGIDVMADVYPYTASSTSLRALLPDWALEGGIAAMVERLRDRVGGEGIAKELEQPVTGQSLLDRVGWENVMISFSPGRKEVEGRRVSELGGLEGALDVLADEPRSAMILFQLDEGDLSRALVHPRVMIGSDGSALAPYGELGEGQPHPPSYGTVPPVLGEYVRERRVITLAQAIHKMTGLPARRLGLHNRGVIRPGAKADLVVFNPRRVGDRATYDAPHQYPEGIE